MPALIATKTLTDGTVAAIAIASARGGKWGRPTLIRVVTLPFGRSADDYKSVRSAKDVLFVRNADARYSGPRSAMGRAKAAASALLASLN